MRHEHIPAGYDPTLDRQQPEPMRRIIVVLFLAALGVTGGLIFMGVRALQAQQPAPVPTLMMLPTETETPTSAATPTPDAWGATGTAIAMAPTLEPSATPVLPDYCGWLTPSPTPFPTLEHTPDAWGATGTAVWKIAHPSATPWGLPRELCNDLPQWTPTFTPFPLPGMTGGTPAMTWTPLVLPPDYSLQTREASALNPPTLPPNTAEPRVEYRDREVQVEVPVEVMVTRIVDREVQVQVPVYITAPPIIITATMPPMGVTIFPDTPTASATATSSPTATATATATATPTSTPTSTATATATATATETGL